MSATTTSRRMERGLRNHPAPLDMSFLGVPSSYTPRRRHTIVSAVRPSVKESITALDLDYSLSPAGIPGLSDIPNVPPFPRPLPKIPDSQTSRSSLSSVLDISSDPSNYTTDTSEISFDEPLLTTPTNLTKLYALSLSSSPVHQESAEAAIRPLPPPPPPDPSPPVTPPLLTPAPVRPARRWGMAVFPQNTVIRRVSSAPSSPISFDNSPASPSSIIAIKSPVEWRDSGRTSNAFSLMNSFAVSLPQETGILPVPPIPTQIPPLPSIEPTVPPVASSLPPALLISVPDDISAEVTRSVSNTTLGKDSLVAFKGPDSPGEAEGKQLQSPQVKAGPKHPRRATNFHHKRVHSTHRHSVRRPNRRLMLKRDSSAPFTLRVAIATEPHPPPLLSETEGAEVKEGRGSSMRWSTSRRFLQKRAKATVVIMRKGKEIVEEKDIVAVIPQLRELKAPKRLKL